MNPQSTLPPTPAALPPKTGDPSAPIGSGHKGPARRYGSSPAWGTSRSPCGR